MYTGGQNLRTRSNVHVNENLRDILGQEGNNILTENYIGINIEILLKDVRRVLLEVVLPKREYYPKI